MKQTLYFFGIFIITINYSFAQITINSDKNGNLKIITKIITFPSKDGLPITADFYSVIPQKDFAVLCHQARFSRGEYKETAPLLALKGISSLAIDQRSGEQVKGIINETAKRAKEKGLATDYLSAKQDIEAAIDFAYKKNHNQPIILIGSSYSASLALLIGNKNNKVKAIAVFSPGEYLKGITLSEEIKDLNKPVFVTAAKNEIPSVKKLLEKVDSKYIFLFEPPISGFHGSKALWKENEGHEFYWKAFNNWLKNNL